MNLSGIRHVCRSKTLDVYYHIIVQSSKKHKNKAIDVVVEDGTKIFIGVDVYNQMKRHSINIYVQYPINLKELYYNPTSPTGASLDDEDLRKALQESTGLNAINVFGRDSYV